MIALTRFSGDEVFPGYSWKELRDGGRELDRNGVRCHTGVEIQSAVGCPYDCTYCPYSSFLCVRTDVETLVDRVRDLVEKRPKQLLYKLNNRTDTLGLEPEHGVASALIELFSQLDRRYLLLYTKGGEVDHLLDLDHQNKTIASFTITPPSVAKLLEPSAPTTEERLEAIEKLSRAGYPIRLRFSPIVPIENWRQIYHDLIEDIYRRSTPEMITLWTLSMIDIDELDRLVPFESLDSNILDETKKMADAVAQTKGAPFPAQIRIELYKEIASMIGDMNRGTRVSLCLETDHVWQGLEKQVVAKKGSKFLCNCGPSAILPHRS